MKKIIILLVSAILLHACKQEDADQIVILVQPSSKTVNASENIYFDINARTVNRTIVRVDISSFDAVNGLRHICTLNPDSKIYTGRYYYRAPDIPVDTLDTEFVFSASDNLENETELSVKIRITGNTALLQESSGISLYTPNSGKQDALSLKSCNTLISSVAGTDEADIYVYANDSTAKDTMTGEWRSMTGLKFSKFNSFNYASATERSLEAVYASSVKQDNVTDLQIDDVILVGDDMTAAGVIKIVGIFDESGFENDRYLINVKTVRER